MNNNNNLQSPLLNKLNKLNKLNEPEILGSAIKNYDEVGQLDKEYSLFAMYMNRSDAERAVKSLRTNDFKAEDISLLTPEQAGEKDFVYHQQQNVLFGASIGAIIGFFLLGTVGIYIGANNPEQLGVNSWIMSTVLGSLIGLASGAACGALVGIGATQSAGKRYGLYLKEGGIVLAVKVNNEEERLLAVQLLEKNRGQDINVLRETDVWDKILTENKKLVEH